MISIQHFLEWNKIIQPCRAFTHVLCQPSEFFKGLVDALSQIHHFPFHVAESLLYVAEEAPGTG